MGLVEHAEFEMKKAGLYESDSDYGGMIPEAVLALVKAHSEQGHSGGSHWVTLKIFNKVANFENLTPISSDPSEWIDRSELAGGKPCWQNIRCSSKFSNDGGKTCYDINKPLKFRRIRRLLKMREFES